MLVRAPFFGPCEETHLSWYDPSNPYTALCELVATRLLSLYDAKSIELAVILTTPYNAFAGAKKSCFDSDITDEDLVELLENGAEDATSALEVGPSSSDSHLS